MEQVRTRIAPSPTGFAHIGIIYQALFDFAFAKKHGGQFIIRIEDTDRARFVEGAEELIYRSVEWFNLEPDESPEKGGPYAPYRQSERLDIYKKYAIELIEKGYAYYCFCTPERLAQMREEQQRNGKPQMYDKHCLALTDEEIKKNLESDLKRVIRLKVQSDQKVRFFDEIGGEIEFDSNLIDDQVLLKSDGFPTYHLGVVVDDYLMKITHIFRGTEWIPSTPKHILLYRYLGWEKDIPKYAHLPLILNSDSPGKLSKRHAAASVDFYRTEGYLPEAILNYLSNIVWNHPEGKEIYSYEEFTKLFEIRDLQAKGAKFDLKKLEWMNGEYIRKMSDEDLTIRLQEFLVDHPNKDKIGSLIPLIKERIKKLSDFVPLTDFIFDNPEYDIEVFQKLGIEQKNISIKDLLTKITGSLESLPKPWTQADFETKFRELAKEVDLPAGAIFQLIRVAVSGQTVTPPLLESMKIIGEDGTIDRIKNLAEKYPNI